MSREHSDGESAPAEESRRPADPGATGEREPAGSGTTAERGPAGDDQLAARLDVLREENRRLRRERRRLRQTRYRRTAAGLGALGLVALAGAALFPASRSVLLALAGVGLFSGVLAYYLTPERFVAAGVGEAAFAAHADTVEGLVADLGLREERVYVPTGDGARCFVPQHAASVVPSASDLEDVVVVTDDERGRGIAVVPAGARLAEEFERTLAGDPADEPALLGEQVADGLVEAFELAASATADAGDGRLTVRVIDPAYGDVARFDHPVASFVGAAVARALDRPVELAVESGGDEPVDALVTATWEDPTSE